VWCAVPKELKGLTGDKIREAMESAFNASDTSGAWVARRSSAAKLWVARRNDEACFNR